MSLYTFFSIIDRVKNAEFDESDIVEEIKKHLLQFRGENRRKIADYRNLCVSMVCNRVCEILNEGMFNEFYCASDFIKISYPGKFDSKWFENVDILLPDSEQVMKVLPYLLTCYAQNTKKNRIDPFGCSTVSPSWMDIFQDFADEENNQQNKEGGGNRSRAITQLTHYFTELPKMDVSVLFNRLEHSEYELEPPQETANKVICRFLEKELKSLPETEPKAVADGINEILLSWKDSDTFELDAGSIEPENEKGDENCTVNIWSVAEVDGCCPDNSKKDAIKELRNEIEAWERLRIFAACCEACEDYERVNMTLSVAYLSKTWTNNKMLWQKEKFSHCTQDGVALRKELQDGLSKDCFRKSILESVKKESDSEIYLLHGEAVELFSRYTKRKK